MKATPRSPPHPRGVESVLGRSTGGEGEREEASEGCTGGASVWQVEELSPATLEILITTMDPSFPVCIQARVGSGR